MDLQFHFERASKLAEQGDYEESVKSYRTFLDAVQGPRSEVPSAQQPQVVRSAAFNLAQVLNKLGDYENALRYVELGLACSPTAFGRAIACSAKGEALCGLGRDAEGQAAFDDAMQAHPVVGRLNSADSMTRLGSDRFLRQAEELVAHVERASGHALDRHLRAESLTILGKVAAKRGDHAGARGYFEKVLREYADASNGCADARLQLRLLQDVPVKWQCIHCGKKLNAPPHMAGKKGKCPGCKIVQTIPSN